MNNFKSGSGNLDFGDSDEDAEKDATDAEKTETQNEQKESESTGMQQSMSPSPKEQSSDMDRSDEQSAPDQVSGSEDIETDASAETYPYFVRRRNVGDERDTRLEIHVRDKVANQEAEFRSELAEQLGATEISKTDAREFALLAAFHHPDRVAELMQEEGYGTLD